MKGNKIFDFSRLGFQQIINTMTKKINEVVELANEMFPRLDEYISKVDWNKIINSDLYQSVLSELSNTNAEMEDIKKDNILINSQLKKSSQIYIMSNGGNTIGECNIIITENGKVVVIDCGFESDFERFDYYFKNLGINKIDLFILTHQHSDHAQGFKKFAENYPITKVIWKEIAYTNLPQEDITDITPIIAMVKETCERYNIPLVLATDETIYFSPSETIKIMCSNFIDYTTYNANSLVILYENKNRRVLFSGDAGYSTETHLKGKVGKVDIHKLGHHGGAGSNGKDFLSETRGTYVIYNGFYNPNVKTVLDTCRCYYSKCIGLDDNGGLLSFAIIGDSILHNHKYHNFNSPWCSIEGVENEYFEKSPGILAKNEYVYYRCNDFYIMENEVLHKNGFIQYGEKDYYYASTFGSLLKNEWVNYNNSGTMYYMGNDGLMLRNITKFIDGKNYTFNDEGICTNYNANK